MVVEDRLTSMVKEMRFCEGVIAECEDALLDGPVGTRVAVVDIEPGRGTIAPGAHLLRTGPGRTVAEFELPDELQPVHFLKVSHHGSETGIPRPDGLVQKLFPKTAPAEPIPAVVSMYPAKDWPSIPAHEEMSKVFKGRCRIHYMHEECPADPPWLDYEFEG